MRFLVLGELNDLAGCIRALRDIENASREDIESVLDGYTVSGSFTETRTLNVASPTTANLAAVLATIITDIKSRGQNRA